VRSSRAPRPSSTSIRRRPRSSALQWQAGQHQPDQVAAAVIAFDVLAPVGGERIEFASPLDRNRRPPPEWMTKSIGGPDRSVVGASAATMDAKAAAQRRLSRTVKGGRGYNPLAHLGQLLSE
jgi:hypothetical protein